MSKFPTLAQSSHLLFFQTSLVSLGQHKSDLFHINVEIHNFLAELSCCPGVVFNTPPSSLGRKDKQQHQLSSQAAAAAHHRQTSQLTMTSEQANSACAELQIPELFLQQQLMPARKETAITKGLKDKVVSLYSKWDEAFHK